MAQARSEMRADALQKRLQNLVSQGRISQEQADQYLEWQQARPDMEPFWQQLREWKQARPHMPTELKEWWQSGPDMPLGFGFRGHPGFRERGRCGGWGRIGAPEE